MTVPSRAAGNVLFLILIAVALFAALSYAVTNSSRSGGNNSDAESSKMKASVILQYASLVEKEITKLRILNSKAWDEIDLYNFESRLTSGGAANPSPFNHNPNCLPVKNPKCSVFMDSGGTVQAREFLAYSNEVYSGSSGHPTPGRALFYNTFVENVGSTSPEVVMYISDLKKEICDAINVMLGLPLADTQAIVTPNTRRGNRDYWTEASDYNLRLPGAATAYIGQKSFCAKNASYGYQYVHVMIER